MAANQSVQLCLAKCNGTEIECAICYKRIYKTVFTCSEPCNKKFHMQCVEKVIDQTEESAYMAYKKPQYKCCYCRRELDMDRYYYDIYMRELSGLRAGGYDIREAVQKVNEFMANKKANAIDANAIEANAIEANAIDANAIDANANAIEANASETDASETDDDEEELIFNVYIPLDTSHIKQPKQSKRADFKQQRNSRPGRRILVRSGRK